VADLRFKEYAKREGRKPDALAMAFRSRRDPVKFERNFAAVYRMMRSLVHCSLVAELQGKRPKFWFKVTWEGDKLVGGVDPDGKLFSLGYLEKSAHVKIGNAVYEIPPPRRPRAREARHMHERKRNNIGD
jgi:hypothetical protein